MDTQPKLERFSRLLHQEIARRLESGELHIIELAKSNLRRFGQLHQGLSPAHQEWLPLLDLPVAQVSALLRSETDNSLRLFSSTPFAGAIDQKLRMEIWRNAA
jgi:hypothetical protein